MASRGDAFAIRCPCHSEYPPCMTTVDVGLVAGEEITFHQDLPDMYRSIVACRSDTCTIGRPGEGIDKTRMVIIGVEVPTGKSIPYQYFLIIARGSNACSFG